MMQTHPPAAGPSTPATFPQPFPALLPFSEEACAFSPMTVVHGDDTMRVKLDDAWWSGLPQAAKRAKGKDDEKATMRKDEQKEPPESSEPAVPQQPKGRVRRKRSSGNVEGSEAEVGVTALSKLGDDAAFSALSARPLGKLRHNPPASVDALSAPRPPSSTSLVPSVAPPTSTSSPAPHYDRRAAVFSGLHRAGAFIRNKGKHSKPARQRKTERGQSTVDDLPSLLSPSTPTPTGPLPDAVSGASEEGSHEERKEEEESSISSVRSLDSSQPVPPPTVRRRSVRLKTQPVE